ncbi:MAG: MinD/ParA family protein [Pseudomonadota bacterium]
MTSIVSTHSYRGGTGKSNITANTAALLATRGNRVGIIDTDIQSPGIHALFHIDPKALKLTLNDYLWGRCAVEDCAVDVSGAIVDQDGGSRLGPGGAVFLVPSSIRTGEIARILKEGYDVNALNDGVRELCERLQLDFLLIDTHPGVNEETLLSIAISDSLLLIMRPDVQDYQGTAVTLELARRLEVPQLLIIVNKALPAFDFRDLSQRIFETYKSPVGAILPLSEDMVRLGSNGLISMLDPDHPISQSLDQVAGMLGPDQSQS